MRPKSILPLGINEFNPPFLYFRYQFLIVAGERELRLDGPIDKVDGSAMEVDICFEYGYIKVISGDTVIGTGLFSEIGASFSDAFGIESDSFSNKLEKAKESALKKIIRKSVILGGNALIGINFGYIRFINNMIGVSVTATSLVIEEKHKSEDMI